MKITPPIVEKGDIRRRLKEVGVEYDGLDNIVYFLRITNDGTFVDKTQEADHVFVCPLDPRAYQHFPDGHVEIDLNSYVEEAVDDLYNQVCEYFNYEN